MDIIFISGIFMSFFIVLLLLTKRKKTLPDKILAVWITFIGIHLLGFYYNQAGYWERYPHLIGITAPIPLFHGPLLYLYCLYTLKGAKKLKPVSLVHFIPGVGVYLYMTSFFFFYTAKEKLMVDSGELKDFETFSLLLLIAIFVSGLSYSIFAFRLTIQHKHKIENQFSYHEGISLKWLRYCIISMGLVFLFAVFVFIVRDAMNVSFPFNPEYLFYTIMIALIFYIGYFGIKQENIFISNPAITNDESEKKSSTEKYKHSGMKEEVAIQLYEKLLQFMDQEKPFLNPKLNLAELAAKLEITTNQLSQIINQQAGVNFHDFVNKYRIEEFLQRAKTNRTFSLLALALDSGFNSKSSFNYIFKKQKGVSPSQYIAKILS
ncbi:MAG: helix-turn-helix domain-containing protein [Bacteroidetes bacterium]|nr:helix-turn-helix domain-containing protein [Bacteroidota bacterium]